MRLLRMPTSLCTVLALALLLAACDTPHAADVATAESVANTAAALAEPTFPAHILTAIAAASPSMDANDERATAAAAVTPIDSTEAWPTIAASQSEMIAATISMLRMHEAILSGQPEVLLAMAGTPASMRDLGLNVGYWDPACQRPLYLIILNGDLDASSLIPGAARSGNARVTYIAFVYDFGSSAAGDVTVILTSNSGAEFRQALQDPSLPEPMFGPHPTPAPPYWPCSNETD